MFPVTAGHCAPPLSLFICLSFFLPSPILAPLDWDPIPPKPAPRTHILPQFSSSPSFPWSPLTLSLSAQVEMSMPARIGTKPGQVCKHNGVARLFQDQCSFPAAGILIGVPDIPQASRNRAGMYCASVSIEQSTYQTLVDLWCHKFIRA